MKPKHLTLVLWIAVSLWLLMLLNGLGDRAQVEPRDLTYSQFLSEVKDGSVQEVTLREQTIEGTRTDGSYFETFNPGDRGLVDELLNHGVVIRATPPDTPGLLAQLLAAWLPFLLLIGVWFWFMQRNAGGGGGGSGGIFNFGKSRARQHAEGDIKVTLKDVAGVEEAKEEVAELVEFLRSPKRFHDLGGHIPRGVLMVGPPGTGKTLLARAIAGEAKVPFFSISGSDFVEMFVGVGASRVRDLFVRGQEGGPLHHLHRRDRRRRAPPRGGPGRGERRARTDPEPAPGGDGRLRRQRGHHRHRRHQPRRCPRPGPAAPRALRPPGGGGAAGPARAHRHPPGAHAQGPAGGRRGRRDHRARDPGLLRGGPRQPGQRGGPVRRPRRPASCGHGAVRAGQGQDHDGRGAAQRCHDRGGEALDGLPRGWTRHRRAPGPGARPGAQGEHHPARSGPGGHPVPARARSLQHEQAPPGEPDFQPVRRAYRRGHDLRARGHHHRAPPTTSSGPRRLRATW